MYFCICVYFEGAEAFAKILVYQEGFSFDSFHAASEGGYENIVSLFFERVFKVQAPLNKPQACQIM